MISTVIIQLVISYIVRAQLGNYMLYIQLYIIFYFVGMCWSINKINIKYFIGFGRLLIIAATVRIIVRIVFDDTVLYNVIIVEYTQAVIGFYIFGSLYVYCRSNWINEYYK